MIGRESVILFAFYSFVGWVIEAVYRSVTQKRPVNPGFMYGPFVPIYGIGALLVITVDNFIATFPLPFRFLIFGIILSAIEFAAGAIFERFFNLTLWDYSNSPFNFKGKICLHFSLAWAALALFLVHILHPATASIVDRIDPAAGLAGSIAFSAYCAVDVAYSVVSLRRFRKNLAYLYKKYVSLNNLEIERIIASFRRILGAFPNLNSYLNSNLSEHLRERVGSVIERISGTLEEARRNRRPEEEEYLGIVRDILDHPEFLRLKDFFHHNSSIYEHARIVSYLSYRVCKYLGLDYVSAARGGLLHDFFLYDWRNHDEPDLPRNKFHGPAHPRIALKNAVKYFSVNEIEKDIIVKHMWPLTFAPPRYRESFIVTFADKFVSSSEFIDEIKKRRENAGEKRSGGDE